MDSPCDACGRGATRAAYTTDGPVQLCPSCLQKVAGARVSEGSVAGPVSVAFAAFVPARILSPTGHRIFNALLTRAELLKLAP